MIRHLAASLVLTAVACPALADGPDLREARKRWLTGDYPRARALYQEAARLPASREAGAIGVSRTWQSEGAYDKALGAIDAALASSPDAVALHARRAELLFLRGDWEQAEHAAARALELQKDNFAARWVRAELYRCRGDLAKADAEQRWFVRTYSARNDADKEIKDPDELLLVGLAGCQNARWNNLPDQFQFVLSDVYGDALRYEKDFWPAEFQAGMLLLEKYNRGDAVAAFDKALKINPRAALAWAGKGMAALQRYEVREAESFAEHALKINPRLPEALRLRADVELASGAVAKARELLERARGVNPRDEATLGRIGACLVLEHNESQLAALVREVTGRDSKPGEFYLELAERLEERRHYAKAETYYKMAAEAWPVLGGAPAALGLLDMATGKESEARPLLERAFRADPFNVRVANMWKVLHHLDGYTTVRTEHFIVRYQSKRDTILARYLVKLLEQTYADLSARFHYAVREPILVELFGSREMFSGRMVGLPDLHTVAASTGSVVAIASPHADGIKRPFNWGSAVRHELVHVFNLQQTAFRVPHWLTEGLAVENEGMGRRREWNILLLEHVVSGQLMNLDTIDLSFIRPHSRQDWDMAYCQARLYVDYLEQKYGGESVGKLLQAYADGQDTAGALSRACAVDKATFEHGYREFLQGVAKGLRPEPSRPARSLLELQAAHEKDPADVNTAAELAEQFLLRRRFAEARRLADLVLAKRKAHSLASHVKAQLLLNSGDESEARITLEAALDRANPEPRIVRSLGDFYMQAHEFGRAAEMFELGRRAQPYETRWLAELAKAYAEAGDADGHLRTLVELVPTDANDIENRKKLARLLTSAGRYADAERYARQAIEIDVLDADAERALGEALLGAKKWSEAVQAFSTVLEIDDRADDARLQLAQAYLGGGDRPRAETEVTRVLTHDPANPEALRLQGLLSK
jgi:tetratricopeptide (TPR) repeat protein